MYSRLMYNKIKKSGSLPPNLKTNQNLLHLSIFPSYVRSFASHHSNLKNAHYGEKRKRFTLLSRPNVRLWQSPFKNRSQERYRIISKQTIVEVLWIRKYFERIRIRNSKLRIQNREANLLRIWFRIRFRILTEHFFVAKKYVV